MTCENGWLVYKAERSHPRLMLLKRVYSYGLHRVGGWSKVLWHFQNAAVDLCWGIKWWRAVNDEWLGSISWSEASSDQCSTMH